MKFRKLFQVIEENQKKDPQDVYTLLARAQEEVGELSTALLVENGDKNRELDEAAIIEAIDVVIIILSIFFTKGGTQEKMKQFLEEKTP